MVAVLHPEVSVEWQAVASAAETLLTVIDPEPLARSHAALALRHALDRASEPKLVCLWDWAVDDPEL